MATYVIIEIIKVFYLFCSAVRLFMVNAVPIRIEFKKHWFYTIHVGADFGGGGSPDTCPQLLRNTHAFITCYHLSPNILVFPHNIFDKSTSLVYFSGSNADILTTLNHFMLWFVYFLTVYNCHGLYQQHLH